jgi:ABC-type sugar transport system ATPase subunit
MLLTAACAVRFYDVTGGRILVDGRDIRDVQLRSLHSVMGLVAQDTQLFAGTVEQNIAYGVEKYEQGGAFARRLASLAPRVHPRSLLRILRDTLMHGSRTARGGAAGELSRLHHGCVVHQTSLVPHRAPQASRKATRRAWASAACA